MIAAPGRGPHPIGRSGAALVGAVAMMLLGLVPPERAWQAISGDTIALLLGMMILSVHLDDDGVYAGLTRWLAGRARSGRQLLVWISVASAGLSAFLVNDTVCLVFTPVVVQLCRASGLPMTPFLLALATNANIGSAATLVGNPQNMLVGTMSGIPFAEFASRSGLAAVVGVALNTALLLGIYGRRVAADLPAPSPTPTAPIRLRSAAVFSGVALAFFAGAHLGLTALAGAALVTLLARSDLGRALERVDWALLVFFAGLFILVEGLRATGLVSAAFAAVAPAFALDSASGVAAFVATLVAGSNVVSNVPMVVLAGPEVAAFGGDPTTAWLVVAFASTVAGNLTLVGSVANLIVAEGAREHHVLAFWEYTRFGALSTLVVLLVGVPLLFAF